MPGMHFMLGFIYSFCWPFTKSKEKMQKFKETGDPQHIYENKLDKACFQHDMGYGDFKYLARETTCDKLLRDKAFSIAKKTEYDGYQRGLASIIFLTKGLLLNVHSQKLKLLVALKVRLC